MFRTSLLPQVYQSAKQFFHPLHLMLLSISDTGRGRKQGLSYIVDFCVSVCALWLAYSFRLGRPFTEIGSVLHVFLIVPPITVLLLLGLGVYRWVVRSTNFRLFIQLVKGSILSSFVFAFLVYFLPPADNNSRYLFVIYALTLVAGTCAARMLWQGLIATGSRGVPIAIYGAGAAGRQLFMSLAHAEEYRPVFFIDDNPRLANTLMAGLPVMRGTCHSGAGKEISDMLCKHEVHQIVLAMPSLGSKAYSAKLDELESMGVRLSTMPTLPDLLSGKLKVDEIRDISISDILGRQEVSPDPKLIGHCVTGKSVLVTGGGGSIGSELCRQIMMLRPARLIVVDNSEASLYHINEELNAKVKFDMVPSAIEFKAILCSVTDQSRMRLVMAENNIETVYHAAAYKHVPIVEEFPEQGIETNIFGTLSVLDSALTVGVDHFVLISTDKAVRPTSSMGATKRIAELVLQSKAPTSRRTRVCMVRFGNVLGSSGSVVPKFKKQIVDGGPITLTDPDVKRFFMTIPEATQLVLQAGAIARGGDVFVLDMGELIRIEDMARTMVRLYGKRLMDETGDPNDIQIVIQGLRPGEKMIEELFLTEQCENSVVPRVSTARETWIPWNELRRHLDQLRELMQSNDRAEIREFLLDLAFLRTELLDSRHALKRRQKIESEIENKQSGPIVGPLRNQKDLA